METTKLQAHRPRSELAALTSLRGIAAILVMCHHFMFVLLLDIGELIPSKLFFKSYLWVDLFFILSGFVLAYVYQNQFRNGVTGSSYRRFMQTRFARIYPLHLFILLLFVGFEVLQWLLSTMDAEGMDNLPEPFTGDQSTETLVTNLLLVQTLHWKAYWNQPAWSISAEWIIYFSLPFLMRWLLPAAHRSPISLTVTALVPLAVIEWHFGDLGLYYAGWPMLIRCLSEAALGLMLFRCYQVGLFSKIASGRLLMPVFALNLVLLALPIPGVVSVAGFVWLVLCAARLPSDESHPINHPILVYLGKISYSIYLVHWFVMDLVRESVAYFTGVPVSDALSLVSQIIVMVGLILIVLGLSHITYHRLESPMRDRLKPRRFAHNPT
ncbi:acyltransferase family protein [Marinobacter sp. F4206]|uniref:acyltransferase family protein n=1 Tax=Marinobacter sp. F4206 TaxID=2861777 RepID=UPI001C5E4954|nr:acyltransferase [Marinobacter sp. F4206]MBW4933395.1 acyltransferase [Marinobacter sp. F4206]